MSKKYITFLFACMAILGQVVGKTVEINDKGSIWDDSNATYLHDSSKYFLEFIPSNGLDVAPVGSEYGQKAVINPMDSELEDQNQALSTCSMTQMATASGLGRPQGVLVVGNKILVADGQDAVIHVYTVDGSNLGKISSFGTYGNGSGQFNNPQYLAVDNEGNIYVSQAGNGKISILRFNGDQLEFVKFHSQSYVYPTGLAIQGNYLFLSETQTSTLRIFTIAGGNMTEVGTFNDNGAGLGQLNQPFGLRVKDSLLYVADRNNSRVQVFKIRGNQLAFFRSIGGNGMGNGQFQFPTDLELVGNEVYVADRGNGRIQVFYFDGQQYRWLENYKQSTSAENAPSGLARMNDGMFVSDQETRELQWVNIPQPADYGIMGKSVYTAFEPISLEVTTTGIGYTVNWYKSPNSLVASQSVYAVANASTRQNGTYFALLTNGCRTITTTSINLLVNRLDQTVTGFVLPKDTFLLIDKYYVLNNIRFSGSNVVQYATSDPTVAYWQFSTSGGDTIRFQSEGEAILTVSNNGTIYYNPVQASLRVVVMDLDPSIVRVPQTITGQVFEPVRLGEMEIKSLKLNFIASSGLPINYTADSYEGAIFDLVGDSLAIYGLGTITITGFQKGNRYFLPSSRVTAIIQVVPDTPTSINENDLYTPVRLYPNPAPVSTWVTIKTDDQTSEWEILNTLGEVVSAEANGPNFRLKAAGTYFIRIKNRFGIYEVKKLVVY